MTALVLLAVLQLVATWLSVRSRGIRSVLKSEPTLLVRDGQLLAHALRAQRVTEGEVRQAVRSQCIGGMEQVAAVVQETDGTLSVIPTGHAGQLTALHGVAVARSAGDPPRRVGRQFHRPSPASGMDDHATGRDADEPSAPRETILK